MGTKLERISQMSQDNLDMVFTSIGHLINRELLKDCHEKMDGDKVVGNDGITKEEYSRSLEENLENLVERLKKKTYKPQSARRVRIPKENESSHGRNGKFRVKKKTSVQLSIIRTKYLNVWRRKIGKRIIRLFSVGYTRILHLMQNP